MKKHSGNMLVYVVVSLTSDGYGYTVYQDVEAVFSTPELAQEFVTGYDYLRIVECELGFVEE